MLNKSSLTVILLIFICTVPFSIVLASSDDSEWNLSDKSDTAAQPTTLNLGLKAFDQKDYPKAIEYFSKALAENGDNANVHNLLGFSFRKSGNVEKALEHYKRALNLEKNHLRANAYLGELYLEQKDLKSAEQQLKILQNNCPQGCKELTELQQAITKYKSNL